MQKNLLQMKLHVLILKKIMNNTLSSKTFHFTTNFTTNR